MSNQVYANKTVKYPGYESRSAVFFQSTNTNPFGMSNDFRIPLNAQLYNDIPTSILEVMDVTVASGVWVDVKVPCVLRIDYTFGSRDADATGFVAGNLGTYINVPYNAPTSKFGFNCVYIGASVTNAEHCKASSSLIKFETANTFAVVGNRTYTAASVVFTDECFLTIELIELL